MTIYVDIDNTICITNGSDYENSIPIIENIEKINKLFYEGNEIVYWTARGMKSRINHYVLTKQQLKKWGCVYTKIKMKKPSYDLFICDKSKSIEEL